MDRNASSTAFQCKNCEFTTHYNYFGKQPPFCKEVMHHVSVAHRHFVDLCRLLEDAYIMKDPFIRESGFMVIGSHCSLCHTEVCCSQECSIFYYKRFCMPCSMKHLDEFPAEIQQELLKNGKSG